MEENRQGGLAELQNGRKAGKIQCWRQREMEVDQTEKVHATGKGEAETSEEDGQEGGEHRGDGQRKEKRDSLSAATQKACTDAQETPAFNR